MNDNDMTCKELVDLVTEYLDDALPSGRRERFEQHLGACGGCRIYLHQMQQTIRSVGALREENVAADANQALLAAFRDWKRDVHP